jgi:hypothetical protein
MQLIDAVKKIEAAGMHVLLEADKTGPGKLRAYAWSGENGYESYVTVPDRVYDSLDEAEVAVLERVIAGRGPHAAA